MTTGEFVADQAANRGPDLDLNVNGGEPIEEPVDEVAPQPVDDADEGSEP